MKSKKILVLLPDGVGLRNFAYSNFVEAGKKQGFQVLFWNQSPFPINNELNFDEIALPILPLHPFTDIFKRSRKEIEIRQFYKKTSNKVYFSYLFSPSNKGLKNKIKNLFVTLITFLFNSEKGLELIRILIKRLERKSLNYKRAKDQLIQQRPDLVFCTNQRASQAITPILAAQDLNIPTACFIFSWDNLPKATMVIETDYYMVWSDYMKKELQYYYPYITAEQIEVTGTPQFENHTNTELISSKEAFFETYQLDRTKKYICFSGDDITTSPYDQCYLEDVAKAVRELNSKGQNLEIIFRRSPADCSNRYDAVIEKFQQEINLINPLWKNFGNSWNLKMPLKGDTELLISIIFHTELVINVGSTMVFDFITHNKPCVFINYNPQNINSDKWDIKNIYKFIHFNSMPNKKSVFWVDSKQELGNTIETLLGLEEKNLSYTREWFKVINKHPIKNASYRIWETINNITSNT
jgi:hypothetical protein